VSASYVFRVRVRFDAEPGVAVDPATVETVVVRDAPEPGEEGWLFFRDHLWRGEAADESHLRTLATDWLGGVDVEAASFSELRTDRAYLDALREAIAGDLAAFNADGVDEVLHKYLGSSVRVVDGGEDT
jgi:hypothetical protein